MSTLELNRNPIYFLDLPNDAPLYRARVYWGHSNGQRITVLRTVAYQPLDDSAHVVDDIAEIVPNNIQAFPHRDALVEALLGYRAAQVTGDTQLLTDRSILAIDRIIAAL